MTTNTAEPDVPVHATQEAPAALRALPWLAWAWAAVEAALLIAAPWVFPEALGIEAADSISYPVFLGSLAFAVMVFATAGMLVTRLQPRNTVGWTMLGGGASLGAVFVGYAIGVGILETDPGVGRWFVLLGVVLFGPALYLLGPGLASVFPDGRPLPGWWTVAAWASAVGILVGSVLAAVSPGPLEPTIAVDNPLGVTALPAGVRDIANAITALALVGGGVVGVASLVARYRRATAVTRQQLKWFLYAVVLWAVALPLGLLVGEWFTIISVLSLTLVPIAVVVAIRSHRLYEIDVLINRTLVYVPLVGIVAGLFAALTTLLQAVFTAVTGDTSDAAAVISALAMAALFTPIQNALQAAVDRRFKPEEPSTPSQWDDPEFRAAVEAIVREVTGRRA